MKTSVLLCLFCFLLAIFLVAPMVYAQEQMQMGQATEIEAATEIETGVEEGAVPAKKSANVTVNVTQEVEIGHEVEVEGNETEVSHEMEQEVEVGVEVESAKPSLLERCVERLKTSPLNDGNFTEEQLELICKFVHGVLKRARSQHEKITKCIAEAHLANPAVPFGLLRKRCVSHILGEEEACPEVEVPECEEGYPEPEVDEKGCVIGYKCVEREKKSFEFKLMRCLRERLKRGIRKREAARECFAQLGIPPRKVERRIKVLRGIPLHVLVTHLKCTQLPPEMREEVRSLVKEALKIRAAIERIKRRVLENCTKEIRKITEESLIVAQKEECGKLVKAATRELREEEREVMLRLQSIYDTYKGLVDGQCIRDMMSARDIVKEYKEKREEILSNPNLTMEEKQEFLKVLIQNMIEELRERAMERAEEGKEYFKEGIKSLFGEEDVRTAVLMVLKKRKELIREILEDPEIKEEIISQILENPEDVELLTQALEDREAKARIVNETKRNLKLREKIFKSKEILQKVLPRRLHPRLHRIMLRNIEAENETVIKAEIEEDGRLFFIIPVKVRKIVRFSGDEVLEERGPWWAFLVS